jgi:DNA invertase Pin-like site-specific DNA recombinase
MSNRPLRAALYARVSTTDQTTDNQLLELRRYAEARGWTVTEYVDEGVSGAKESRPALDRLLKDARRRRLDALVVWRLDRLGRSLRHLILTLDELTALCVAFVSLNEGIDTGTSAGRLQLHLLAAISQFERERVIERVQAGLARARAQGKHLGRPRVAPLPSNAPKGLSVRRAAVLWGVSKSTAARRLAAGQAPTV